MPQVVPIYIAYLNDDSCAHIVLGVDPMTLCGGKQVHSAYQIDEDKTPKSAVNDDLDFCDKCMKNWKKIRDKVKSEMTVNCNLCDEVSSGARARGVERMGVGEVPVCRPCYKLLEDDDESTVSVPYEDCDPHIEPHHSRTFKWPKSN